jgi:hypothetical protein
MSTTDLGIYVDEVAATLGDDPEMFTLEEYNLLSSCYIKRESTNSAITALREYWRAKKEKLNEPRTIS